MYTKKDIEELLQDTEDNITLLFEQYLKGSWKDDMGHDVDMNNAMINLKNVLKDIMEFRYEFLDYNDPDDKRNLM